MPRWKFTEQIINSSKDGEYFDENWMNYDFIWQYAPQPILWKSEREINFEDVDLWEVISEVSDGQGFIGVYAAYQPYEEYYIVIRKWSLWKEFKGFDANNQLEKFLIENNISYPKTNKNNNILEKNFLEKTIMI